jgi:U3 small nucleolar RNA-associated protein 23
MKLKRAKSYRKLMHQYEIQFGFREPYQVLLDSAIVQDADRFKIDLIPRLQSVLQGQIKPMISQCSIRHLYNATPKNNALIEQAKTYERRRCNHHTLENPLSDKECLSEVVDAKGSGTNKHRYIVASQDIEVRKHMRKVAGVPLIYISKSVMLLEPMGTSTEEQRVREETSKFRQGLKGQRKPEEALKRKRDDIEGQHGDIEKDRSTDARPQKKSKHKGPAQPNPLSMKKSKKADVPRAAKPRTTDAQEPQPESTEGADADTSGPKKRRRKHKPKGKSDVAATEEGETADS